jgi:uncharacterized protein YggE
MRLVIRAAAFALALAAVPAAAQNAALDLNRGETLLEVNATGTVPSRPDLMAFDAGIVSTGRTAREATDANSALAQRLIEALRAAGIAPRDMQTSALRVSPRFERTDRRNGEDELDSRIIGYVARNTLTVRVRDLRRASAILDSLIAAGANEIHGPRFSLADDRPARRAAREAAIVAAREQAETYAGALGMRVARVLRVSERSARIGSEGFITVTGSRTMGTPIEPGEIETEVQVWVDYALAPR